MSTSSIEERLFRRGLGDEAMRRFWVLSGARAIAASEVDPDIVKTAASFVAEAAGELGIPAPYVRWYRSSYKRTVGYFAPELPDCIWLRSDLAPHELQLAAYHEVGHYADALKGRSLTEASATQFAAGMLHRDYRLCRPLPRPVFPR